MRQRLLTVVAALVLIPAVLRAEPIAIVDTGPGPTGYPGFTLSNLQFVAVEFDVTSPAVITRAEGWMLVTQPGSLSLALYDDGGEVPGALLFRSSGLVSSATTSWQGLSNLLWTVTPGTYWIGFEAAGGGAMSGALPYPSARPLRNGAVVDGESDPAQYVEADDVATMGLRILAETSAAPVPEPSSLLLLGTGVVGLIARRRMAR